MRMIPVCVALGSAVALASCAQSDRNVRAAAATAPVHAAYKDRLARDYADLSLYESTRMYDRVAAERFAAKAMAASRHEPVAPEDPAQWNIKEEPSLAALRQARQRLVGAMHAGAAEAAPGALARAQVQYDCWVEQQAEGWQHRHIASCRKISRSPAIISGHPGRGLALSVTAAAFWSSGTRRARRSGSRPPPQNTRGTSPTTSND